MRIRNKLKSTAAAARIEYHWWHILRLRARGKALLAAGEPLLSPRLLRLSRRIDRHNTIARRTERTFEGPSSAGR